MPDVKETSVAAPSVAAIQTPAPRPQAVEPKPLPQYNVILLDDDDHTYDYVMLMLRRLFGHAEPRGYQLAQCVDKQGRAILMTTHHELAELKRDQIHAFGGDPRLAKSCGSMTAVIEPVV